MARAIVTQVEQAYKDADGAPIFQVGVIYVGGDVDGTFLRRACTVNISGVNSLAELGNAIDAEIRAEALRNGFTIPVGQLILPSFVQR